MNIRLNGEIIGATTGFNTWETVEKCMEDHFQVKRCKLTKIARQDEGIDYHSVGDYSIEWLEFTNWMEGPESCHSNNGTINLSHT